MSTTDAGTGSFEDRGPSVFAVTTATLVLASVFVAARLYTRLAIVRQVTYDDWFIILAWFLAFGVSFTIDLSTRRGLGRHDSDIGADNWNALRRCEYNPALMATKTSILVFYLRLSRNTQQVLRIASWATLVVVNVAGTVLTLLNIFQCRPIQAAFDKYPYQAQCIPLLTEFICSAPVNIVTDLAILALPIPVLTRMRLPFRQKIILVFTFTLGIFVTVVDVIRIYYLQQAITYISPTTSSNSEATFGDQAEFAFNASFSLMWSAVEVNIGIACACIPTLKPLIVRILPAMLVDPDGTRTISGSTGKQASDSSRHYSDDGPIMRPLQTVPEVPSQASDDAHTTELPEPEYSAMEFLTTPNMTGIGDPASPTRLARTSTALTAATTTTSGGGENSVYFGFVNMKKPKSITRTSIRESWKYCTLVIILFVLWGFSYGLLNTLNNAIASVAKMSTAQTIGLTSMYFGVGYLLGPLIVGEWILRHDEHRRTKKHDGSSTVGGFKATFIVGLSIYGIGTIMFWPSAVLSSFPGFMISNFVVGFGLAVLETAANPFIALCGPLNYAEMRLLLAQAIQAVATVISQLLAQKVFFTEIEGYTGIEGSANDSTLLLDVQWTYLAITLLCAALALFFFYTPLPEGTDAEIERSTRYLPIDPKKRSIGGLQLRTWTLIFAVLAQWTYVASQECMSIFFKGLLTPVAPSQVDTDSASLALSLPDYSLVAHTAFALSRFLAAFLAYLSPKYSKVPQPRTVLNICVGLSILFTILVVVLRPSNPNLQAIPVILFYFSEGPIWPLIFTLGLRGQGRRTKRASAYITMGASGPAFWPFVIYAIHQHGASYHIGFIILVGLLFFTAPFAVFLSLNKDARTLVDARVGKEEQQRLQSGQQEQMDLDEIISSRKRTTYDGTGEMSVIRKMSVAFTNPFKNRSVSDPLSFEHREDTKGGAG
ncbi:fucose permease [Truncatella angustata]|uniref:Fucose permease n=1 Tax=Truncatella angustata TaxID=152316 RepID=A0A9P8ZX48_9PEZI|nr:fucose permease [Truncatella angustata]KAH6652639.1 fucose permease [Truncatella angustata]